MPAGFAGGLFLFLGLELKNQFSTPKLPQIPYLAPKNNPNQK